MKLQSLQLHGFKSFADRTTLDFREGVTAIIGSNGSGKSNIADAIRWVLGEQRASVMRGSKMEEVIFQGTARRRPLNFAEVTLLFDNEAGRVPVPQTELEIARKVFREGGSEYSLNRTACRLRDIHNLLRDTGLGSNAYAVIEATMIDTLLSDRAEERRALFEEAAGIGKYKDSRKAATRRLDAAEADLTRLEDLISEVESKVRSLSRQRRKAERHRELRKRRLDLEVAIAQQEVASLERDIARGEGRRKELEETTRVSSGDRSTAEAIVEERRIEAAELGRQRTRESARLEAVRSELDRREREAMLADERRANAETRLQQIVAERGGLESRQASLAEEIEAAAAKRGEASQAVAEARSNAESKGRENQQIKQGLAEARTGAESAASRARELAREIATAEGQRGGAERRRRDALERQQEATERLAGLSEQLADLTDQTELWQSQADDVRERLDAAVAVAEKARESVESLRGREQRARDEARAAEDRLSTLTSQVDAREALERSYEGFSPAVAAIMANRGDFPGVRGPLADYLEEQGSRTEGVESYLGSLLQALVIEDLATARELRRWFHEEWEEGGSLLMLPLDVVGEGDPSGNRWVDRLLAGLEIVDSDPLESVHLGTPRIGPRGDLIDARGVIRLVEQGDAQGILGRRAALRELREQRAEALRQRDARLEEREKLRSALQEAEEDLVRADEARRTVEGELKVAELDAAAHRERRQRLQQEKATLEEAVRSSETEATLAAEQLEQLEQRLVQLGQEIEHATVAEDEARGRLAELERQWDAAREEEAELRVTLARAESELREVEQRVRSAEAARTAAEARAETILKEAEELRAGLENYASVKDRTAGEIQQYFQQRDEATGALALIDARLAEVDTELSELGERARVARRTEGEANEERHRIDLELAEARSKLERVRERLEVEWNKPWSALAAEAEPIEEGTLEEWRHELRTATQDLEGLGLVNMLALEEHAEESRRLEFLEGQRADLVEARDNLVAAIREINKTAREVFESTFETVRTNFQRTFQSLFQGGECDIWLADPDDPLEADVEIQASPVGKKTQRIHLLSGGERTLTALALLFALYLVKPSPFCVLDEVDAPLDESNVGRFIQLLRDFKHETQFIVITHNPRTMEAADWVYGVTMEEAGVSSIVGVELLGAWTAEEGTAVNT